MKSIIIILSETLVSVSFAVFTLLPFLHCRLDILSNITRRGSDTIALLCLSININLFCFCLYSESSDFMFFSVRKFTCCCIYLEELGNQLYRN